MVYILVPSDVTIAERKTTTGRRRLTVMETVGLWTMLPILHLRGSYSKMGKKDLRAILSKSYAGIGDSSGSSSSSSCCSSSSSRVVVVKKSSNHRVRALELRSSSSSSS
eukprot:Filipodium_phascolosomae@DN3151_c0_g1_i1.p1